jgi:hypothetical protein
MTLRATVTCDVSVESAAVPTERGEYEAFARQWALSRGFHYRELQSGVTCGSTPST